VLLRVFELEMVPRSQGLAPARGNVVDPYMESDAADPVLSAELEALESPPRGTILVADDDPGIRTLLRVVLSRRGFTVIDVENGLAALEMVRTDRPDLVLIDWMMPLMDGLETVVRLKDDPATRDIPVVMLTAQNRIDDKVAGLEAGAQDFLTKPFDNRELIARLEQQLRWRKVLADVSAAAHKAAPLDQTDREALAHYLREAETREGRGEYGEAARTYRSAAEEAARMGHDDFANKLTRLEGKMHLTGAEHATDARSARNAYLDAARCFLNAGNLNLAERSIDFAQSVEDAPAD
jgi:DNA-binding response OmpR family regulator